MLQYVSPTYFVDCESANNVVGSFHGNRHETRKMLKELGVDSRPTSPPRTHSPPRGNVMTVGDKSRCACHFTSFKKLSLSGPPTCFLCT